MRDLGIGELSNCGLGEIYVKIISRGKILESKDMGCEIGICTTGGRVQGGGCWILTPDYWILEFNNSQNLL